MKTLIFKNYIIENNRICKMDSFKTLCKIGIITFLIGFSVPSTN